MPIPPSSPALRPRSLRCVRCGAAFICGSGGRDGGCWCADQPPLYALADGDCLCPSCLAAAIAAVPPFRQTNE